MVLETILASCFTCNVELKCCREDLVVYYCRLKNISFTIIVPYEIRYRMKFGFHLLWIHLRQVLIKTFLYRDAYITNISY
jgi:hypothetical protein